MIGSKLRGYAVVVLGSFALLGCSRTESETPKKPVASTSPVFVIQCDGVEVTHAVSKTIDHQEPPAETRWAFKVDPTKHTVERWVEGKRAYEPSCVANCKLDASDKLLSFVTSNNGSVMLETLMVDRVTGKAFYQYDLMNGEFYIQNKFSGTCVKVAAPEPRPKRF